MSNERTGTIVCRNIGGVLTLAAALIEYCAVSDQPSDGQWYKVNIHTHTTDG